MNKVIFVAPCLDGDQAVCGWQLASGAVVHRALLQGGACDEAWSVSDAVSGGAYASGPTLGAAVRKYRALVAALGASFDAELGKRRRHLLDQVRALQRRGEVPACALVNTPELMQ